MLDIDEKLAGSLRLLYENNGASDYQIDRRKILRLDLSPDIQDIVKMREAVQYIRERSKLQSQAKIIGGDTQVRAEIEAQIAEIDRLVEEAIDRRTNLPRLPSTKATGRKKEGYIGRFQELNANSKKKEIEAKIAEIRATRTSINEEIKAYKQRRTTLTRLMKTLEHPQQLIQEHFGEDNGILGREYDSLIQSCATAMSYGSIGRELVSDEGGEGIFVRNHPNEPYTVDVKKAKSFLRKIRDGESIVAAARYVQAKDEAQRMIKDHRESVKEHKSYLYTIEVADTPDFQMISDTMNEIGGKCAYLEECEYKASRGSVLYRFRNRVREAMHLYEIPPRIPTKVLKLREEISDQITQFADKVSSDKELWKKFYAYSYARNCMDDCMLSVDGLRESAERYRQGYETENIPLRPRTVEEIKRTVMTYAGSAANLVAKRKAARDEAEAELAAQEAGLSKKAQKLLETDGEQRVLEYGRQYYELPDSAGSRLVYLAPKKHGIITPSAAATILESIVGRKEFLWQKVSDAYGKMLGEEQIVADREEITQRATEKKESFIERIRAFARTGEGIEMPAPQKRRVKKQVAMEI